MKTKTGFKDSAAKYERGLKKEAKERYVLRLYITGMTARSKLAIQNIKKICEDQLKDRYELEVIDLYREPVLARGDQIIATPTLIKKLPLPLKTFIGDMTSREKIILGLDLRAKK